jgi:hypothetical protein
MFKFEEVKNPTSGAVEKQARFVGKLESINPDAKPNSNNTMFHNASVSFETAKERVTRQCIVYANNYSRAEGKMELGVEYSGRATVITDDNGKQSILLSLSHLTTAGSASLADFGLDAEVTASADLDDVKS